MIVKDIVEKFEAIEKAAKDWEAVVEIAQNILNVYFKEDKGTVTLEEVYLKDNNVIIHSTWYLRGREDHDYFELSLEIFVQTPEKAAEYLKNKMAESQRIEKEKRDNQQKEEDMRNFNRLKEKLGK